ncbi:MAG: minichromosome maintenance protein MCM, partial [Candidatus Bathyarchaeota archaeon]
MSETKILDPVERFQNFLKLDKYRQKLSQIAVQAVNTIIIDFDDLLAFDTDLAENIVEKPNEYFTHSEKAAWDQLRIEDPEYAYEVKKIRTRFKGLPEKTHLRHVGSKQIGKLIMVDGILVRATSIQP